MSMHPTITAALAEEHRRDLTASAEAYRTVRLAPARHARTIPHLIAAACQPVARVLPPKAPRPHKQAANPDPGGETRGRTPARNLKCLTALGAALWWRGRAA
jgi:hypothetical protein